MSPPPRTPLIDQTTILSLLATAALLLTAYLSSLHLLAPTARPKQRVLFVWHAFDALTHIVLEGSFLYHCFFSSGAVPVSGSSSSSGSGSGYGFSSSASASEKGILGGARAYGCQYGEGFLARLWMEYARADRRWAGADPTVVSLELLTVLVGGPLAGYVCWLVRSGDEGGVWFWGAVLATGEIYGGFMTFAPEWLSGSPNLDTSNFMFLWVYLFFFNMLWVWFPMWVLYEARKNIRGVFATASGRSGREGRKEL